MPIYYQIKKRGFIDGIVRRPHYEPSHFDISSRNFRGAWFAAKSSARRVFPLFLIGFLILMEAVVPLIAFEAHVINVTAKIEPIPCMLVNFDNDAFGDAILPGARIDNEYTPWGLGISAFNNNRDHEDIAIAFNSNLPTGEDMDLGTPNENFAGPGVGIGGMLDAPGENSTDERNILVIAENLIDEDGDGLADDPDDEADGGTLIFLFDEPTSVESIEILDIEEEGALIRLFKNDFGLLKEIPIPVRGNNSVQTIDISTNGVRELRVELPTEGAVNDLCFDPVFEGPMCDARAIGYWRNHEGCTLGEGASIWEEQINVLSTTHFSGVFATTTGGAICENLWIPNCPSGNTIASRTCKARAHTLANELNLVSNRLALNALIAGADDGDDAFTNLGLMASFTVGEALTSVEEILGDASSTIDELTDAGYAAERISSFYESENPIAPLCVFDLASITDKEDANGSRFDIDTSRLDSIGDLEEEFDDRVGDHNENIASTTGDADLLDPPAEPEGEDAAEDDATATSTENILSDQDQIATSTIATTSDMTATSTPSTDSNDIDSNNDDNTSTTTTSLDENLEDRAHDLVEIIDDEVSRLNVEEEEEDDLDTADTNSDENAEENINVEESS